MIRKFQAGGAAFLEIASDGQGKVVLNVQEIQSILPLEKTQIRTRPAKDGQQVVVSTDAAYEDVVRILES